MTESRCTLLSPSDKPFVRAVILDFAPECDTDPVRECVLYKSFPTEHFDYSTHWPLQNGLESEILTDWAKHKLEEIFSVGISYDHVLVVIAQAASDNLSDILIDAVDRVAKGTIINVAHVFQDIILVPSLADGMRWSPNLEGDSFSMLA